MAGYMENFTFYSYFDYAFSKGNVMREIHSNRIPVFVVSFGAGFWFMLVWMKQTTPYRQAMSAFGQ